MSNVEEDTTGALTLEEFDAALEEHIYFAKTISRRAKDAGAEIFSVADRRRPGVPVRLAYGDPSAPVEENPLLETQPYRKVAEAKKLSVCLGVRGKWCALVARIRTKLMAAAVRDGVATLERIEDVLLLPFKVPKGEYGYGVWVNLQMEAPFPGDRGQKLVTKFFVTRRTAAADGSVDTDVICDTYDGNRLNKDVHTPAVLEFEEISEYKGKRYCNLRAMFVSVDEQEAIMDPDYVVPPVTRRASNKLMAFPYADGMVLFGTDAYPEPTWVPATSAVASTVSPTPSVMTMRDRMTTKEVALASIEVVAKEGVVDLEHPPGSKRHFINDTNQFGNVITRVGNLDGPAARQPYLGKKPDRHAKSDPSSTSFGGLLIMKDEEETEALRQIRYNLITNVIELNILPPSKGKKTASREAAEIMVQLPGVEPREEDADNGASAAGSSAEAPKSNNFCLWVKLQMEAPKDISALQTKFYLLSAPGEPFTCERIDGHTLNAGRRVCVFTEWSELKKTQSTYHVVLYAKYVFVTDPGAFEAESVPGSITWGGLTLDMGSAPKKMRLED
jgi:hypothetical protein